MRFGVHSFGWPGPTATPSPRAKSMNGIRSGRLVSSPWPSLVRQKRPAASDNRLSRSE